MVYDIFPFLISINHMICMIVEYSSTNLVRKHRTSCSLCSTWQWPRAFTHTHIRITRHLFGADDNELVSRILERWVKMLEWKTNWSYMLALDSPLAMRRKKELSPPSLSSSSFSSFPKTYLDQFVITWFIMPLAKERGERNRCEMNSSSERAKYNGENMSKWYCVVLVFMACQTI